NPVTRHPSVTAASIAAVDSYAPSRVKLGIGAGDTAVLQVGLRPARLAEMERAVAAIRGLLAGEAVEFGGQRSARLDRPRAVPVIIATGGPKALRMAGANADGVVMRVGADPELIQWSYNEFCGRAGRGARPGFAVRGGALSYRDKRRQGVGECARPRDGGGLLRSEPAALGPARPEMALRAAEKNTRAGVAGLP